MTQKLQLNVTASRGRDNNIQSEILLKSLDGNFHCSLLSMDLR